MRSFCLIVCLREGDKEVIQKPGVKEYLHRILGIFKPLHTESWLTAVTLYEELGVFIISLPFTFEELKGMSEAKAVKIIDFIDETCRLNNIESAIIPDRLKKIPWMSLYSKKEFDGRRLYKSLAGNILSEICKKSKKGLGGINITIIHSGEDEALAQIIGMLSEEVKYLMVVSDNRDKIEGLLNETYSETGLSIGVTKDFKTGIKNADLIINLGNPRADILELRLNEETMILNLGSVDAAKFFSDNTIINGVEVKLPANVILPEDVKYYYSNIELAEIILMHRFIDKDTEYEALKKLEQGFKKDGYLITGFRGRRNILSSEDIKI